jgi:enterochelin esterase-like enzyme
VTPPGRARRWPLLVGLMAVVLAAGCGEPDTFRGLLRSLDGMKAEDRAAAIERFVAARGGTPVIEDRARLVFLARTRDGIPPRVVGDFNGWANTAEGYDVTVGEMEPIDGTDWWWLQGEAYTNARLEYVLLYDREPIPDPLNPRTITSIVGARSEIRMPFWQPHPELDEDTPVPSGEVRAERVTSAALGGERRVWVYLPPGYEAAGALLPVVFVLDGGTWAIDMRVPLILDRLIARSAIPPVIAVFVEPQDRQEEYSRNDAWRRFMTAELVPWVDGRYRTFPSPDRRVVLGSALSAYAAVDLAIEAPAVFGAVAAIAPPVQTATLITNQAHAPAAIRSLRFFVIGGTYDAIVDGARRLRTALSETNAAEDYLEVHEGHNWDMFRGYLDDVLTRLLPAE